jgi:ATP adenylyltransferase
MKRLWTPWRMAYIKAPKEKSTGCIFCEKLGASRTNDLENLVLLRGKRAFAMLNLYPYSNGHLMVAPYEHTGELESLNGDTLKEMMLLVGKGIRALRRTMNPQGFNIGVNMGKVAGAGVEDHVHIHIVPRWNGDTNFIPVLSEVRLIPEMLPQTYDSLLAALKADAATVKKKLTAPRRQRKKKL